MIRKLFTPASINFTATTCAPYPPPIITTSTSSSMGSRVNPGSTHGSTNNRSMGPSIMVYCSGPTFCARRLSRSSRYFCFNATGSKGRGASPVFCSSTFSSVTASTSCLETPSGTGTSAIAEGATTAAVAMMDSVDGERTRLDLRSLSYGFQRQDTSVISKPGFSSISKELLDTAAQAHVPHLNASNDYELTRIRYILHIFPEVWASSKLLFALFTPIIVRGY